MMNGVGIVDGYKVKKGSETDDWEMSESFKEFLISGFHCEKTFSIKRGARSLLK